MNKKKFRHVKRYSPKELYDIWKSKKKWITGVILFMLGASSIVSATPALAETVATTIQSSASKLVDSSTSKSLDSSTSKTSGSTTSKSTNNSNSKKAESSVVKEEKPAQAEEEGSSSFRGVIDSEGRSAIVDYEGQTTESTESYILGGKRDGGSGQDYNAERRKLNLNVGNLKKNDVITVTVPEFKNIVNPPTISGTSSSVNGKVLTYKVLTDNFNASFGIDLVQATDVNKAELTGEVVVKIGDIVAQKIKLTVKTKYRDNWDGWFYPYFKRYSDSVGQNPLSVSSGEDFLTAVEPDPGINSNFSYARNIESLTYKFPVPKGYKLNVALSEKMQKLRNKKAAIYDYSMNNEGTDNAEAVLTFNKDKFNELNNLDYTMTDISTDLTFVGSITGADGTYSGAGKPTLTIKTGIGEKTVEASKWTPFSVIVATHPNGLEKATKRDDPNVVYPEVYVSDSDVGNADVYKGNYLAVGSSGKKTDKYEIQFKIPETATSKAITLMENGYLIANGMTGTVQALGAGNQVLDTIDIVSLLEGRSGDVIWTPSATDIITGYKIVLQGMPNTSFGTLYIQPQIAVKEKPNPKTDVNIPITIDNNGKKETIDNYNTTLVTSKTLYEKPGHIDMLGTGLIELPSPGEEGPGFTKDLVSYQIRPFENIDHPKTAYNILEYPMVLYTKIPDHMTFLSTNKFNENASVIKDNNGNNYVKIVIPAGINLGSSKNPNYNTEPNVGRIVANFRVNKDVVNGQVLNNDESDGSLRMWMGIKDQMDDAFWSNSNSKIVNVDDFVGQPGENLANDAKNYGMTKLYSGALNENQQYKVSLPKIATLRVGIKADGDDIFVSGNNEVAIFEPEEEHKNLGGEISAYAYNGTVVDMDEYTQLITLPKKSGGAPYTINLKAAIPAATGATILYSTKSVKKENLAADKSSFVPATSITNWNDVQSILITDEKIKGGESLQHLLDIELDDIDLNNRQQGATVYTYSYAKTGGTMLGDAVIPLKTSINKQVMVDVRYVDEAGTEIGPADRIKAGVGEDITLTARDIAGYELLNISDSPKTYTVLDQETQDFKFVYKKRKMPVKVIRKDFRTGKQIGGEIAVEGYFDDVIDLTGDKFTKIEGYKNRDNNPTSYTVTKNLQQVVELYFDPLPRTLKVYYKYESDNGMEVADADTISGYYPGDQITLTPKETENFVPKLADAVVTIGAGDNQSYTFYYTDKVKKITNYIPVTGSKASITLLGLGTGLLALSGLCFKSKRKDDEELEELKELLKKKK